MSAVPKLNKPDLDDWGYVLAPGAPRYERCHKSERMMPDVREIAMLSEARRQNELLERIADALERLARGCT